MIDVKNNKVKQVIDEIHAMFRSRCVRGNRIRDDIVTESYLYQTLCNDLDATPEECAVKINALYGCAISEDDIIQILKKMRLSNSKERKEIFLWADRAAGLFAQAIEGNRKAFDAFESVRKQIPFSNKRNGPYERILAIMIYEKNPEIDLYDDYNELFLMGNVLAKYSLYDMSDCVAGVYGFPKFKQRQKTNDDILKKNRSKMTLEEAINKIDRLENNLDRNSKMLKELQEEFEKQLEENKIKELTSFFAKLNSKKYGCILDELLLLQKRIQKIQKNKLPIELSGLLIMIKQLIQFVRDSSIEPILKIDDIKEVYASDIEFFHYNGTPFLSSDEIKLVRVISPGWIYKDKNIQISRPEVKEEKEDE